MSKLTNLFENYREYQSRKVDNPNYEPLGQSITVGTPVKKVDSRKEYQREYYKKNKEKMREYQRKYKMKHPQKYSYKGVPQKYWLKWVQLSVYNYMIEQYQLWDRVPRATQIAKALNVWEQTVYNATAVLVKKWYIGRWALGKYYLINPPVKENESLKNEIKETEKVASKKYSKHVDWEDYSPWYVSSLKHSIKLGQKIIKELRERVIYLEKKLEKVQVVEVNEENKSDYLNKLESQNSKLADEVIMLRKIVKYLSRYID